MSGTETPAWSNIYWSTLKVHTPSQLPDVLSGSVGVLECFWHSRYRPGCHWLRSQGAYHQVTTSTHTLQDGGTLTLLHNGLVCEHHDSELHHPGYHCKPKVTVCKFTNAAIIFDLSYLVSVCEFHVSTPTLSSCPFITRTRLLFSTSHSWRREVIQETK